jgi:5-formyltetrahydrofolate cyclo-ligase
LVFILQKKDLKNNPINNSTDISRDNLRNLIKKNRSLLPQDFLSESSDKTLDVFKTWFCNWCEKNKNNIHRPLRIGAYLSTGGELNLSPIFNYLLNDFKNNNKLDNNLNIDLSLYLPALHPVLKGCLQFREYDLNLDNLNIPNAYGIFEPVYDSNKTMPPWLLDIVLMPLVVCDESGNRLGMGGGYYDRSFAFLSKNWNDTLCVQTNGPILIGVGYDFQKVEGLEVKDWDVSLNAFISPDKGIMLF